jgi:hypothetical protein
MPQPGKASSSLPGIDAETLQGVGKGEAHQPVKDCDGSTESCPAACVHGMCYASGKLLCSTQHRPPTGVFVTMRRETLDFQNGIDPEALLEPLSLRCHRHGQSCAPAPVKDEQIMKWADQIIKAQESETAKIRTWSKQHPQ